VYAKCRPGLKHRFYGDRVRDCDRDRVRDLVRDRVRDRNRVHFL